jgi:cellulose biosynthesis protein BcsQ
VLVTCWSVKGGSGTTVVSAALALSWSRLAPQGALLVDLGGDAPLVLGTPRPPGPGVADWLAAPTTVGPEALDALTLQVDDNLRLLCLGERDLSPSGRWGELATALAHRPGVVVVDAGSMPLPHALLDASDENLLVIRPCYLALQRASRWPVRPSGIVMIDEPGHALGASDLHEVLGSPVRAVVPWDPAVARAVDAGLLRSRLPQKVSHALRGAA